MSEDPYKNYNKFNCVSCKCELSELEMQAYQDAGMPPACTHHLTDFKQQLAKCRPLLSKIKF